MRRRKITGNELKVHLYYIILYVDKSKACMHINVMRKNNRKFGQEVTCVVITERE